MSAETQREVIIIETGEPEIPASQQQQDVVLEGRCYRKGVFWMVLFKCVIACLGGILSVLLSPVFIALCIYWYRRILRNWRVHLTHSNVIYRVTMPYSCQVGTDKATVVQFVNYCRHIKAI